MEMPELLKKGVWKFNIALNNYSKCLMTASTALQTSLKHSFSEEIRKHLSLSRVSFNFQDINSGIDDFSNPFRWTLWKSRVAIRAIVIKPTTAKSFGQAWSVER